MRRLLIYRVLVEGGPMTAQEIMDKLSYTDPNSVRPRLTELKSCGLVRTVGKRPSRITGKQTAVWEATEPGEKKTAPSGANTESGTTGRMANQNTPSL